MRLFSLLACFAFSSFAQAATPKLSAFDGVWIATGEFTDDSAVNKDEWCPIGKGRLVRLNTRVDQVKGESHYSLFAELELYRPEFGTDSRGNTWYPAFYGYPNFTAINDGPKTASRQNGNLIFNNFKHETLLSADGKTLTHTVDIWDSFLLVPVSQTVNATTTLAVNEDGQEMTYTLVNVGETLQVCKFKK